MNETARKEAGFYMMLGCSVLSLVVAWKVRSWWYVLAAVGFAGFSIFAYRALQQAREDAKLPSPQYLQGVKDASFLGRRP